MNSDRREKLSQNKIKNFESFVRRNSGESVERTNEGFPIFLSWWWCLGTVFKSTLKWKHSVRIKLSLLRSAFSQQSDYATNNSFFKNHSAKCKFRSFLLTSFDSEIFPSNKKEKETLLWFSCVCALKRELKLRVNDANGDCCWWKCLDWNKCEINLYFVLENEWAKYFLCT